MDTCVIFCAGGFEKLARQPDETDYILAADGGLTHLQKLGIQPNGIIGDFDSLGYVPRDAQVFPEAPRGYLLLKHEGLSLGFVKNLGNRTNSLHPQSRRIRMDIK